IARGGRLQVVDDLGLDAGIADQGQGVAGGAALGVVVDRDLAHGNALYRACMLADMITVHHLETSRSQRVLWLLEELGLPYEIKFYRRHPLTKLAPPELKKIHPLGKSPVITDGDLVVAESAAILEYLLE